MQEVMNRLVDLEKEVIKLKEDNRKLKDRAKYYVNWVQDLQEECYVERECLEAEAAGLQAFRKEWEDKMPFVIKRWLDRKITGLYKYIEEINEELSTRRGN